MLKQITGTTAARITTTALGFFTVILATQFLGAREYGTISLFLLSVSLLQLVSGIAGGPALVYLVPRMALGSLFAGSLLWTSMVHVLAYFILRTFNLYTPALLNHLLALSFLFYLNSFAFTVLLGKQDIRFFNYIQITQGLLILAMLAAQIVWFPDRSITVYIRSLYMAWGVACLFGWSRILGALKIDRTAFSLAGLKMMIRHGGFLQIANAVQLLNYRLSYFLIDHFLGRSLLGIYTAGVQLSEGLWIFGKSFAIVQYSSISNNDDAVYARNISIKLMKLIFVITLTGLLVLLLLPAAFYGFLFGAGFEEVKTVIVFMSVGILALSISQILSHFFSGTGRQKHNAIGSSVGLVFTLVSGFLLIPSLGLVGAGLTASLAFTAATVYQMWVFVKVNQCRFRDFWVGKADIEEIKNLVTKITRRLRKPK